MLFVAFFLNCHTRQYAKNRNLKHEILESIAYYRSFLPFYPVQSTDKPLRPDFKALYWPIPSTSSSPHSDAAGVNDVGINMFRVVQNQY